jgi:DNA polymerase elongation subunit (family B)
MRKKSKARLLVDDYCKQYKEVKDYTLAKKIYNENPSLFKSYERARDFIRLSRGHSGEKDRKYLLDKTNQKPLNYDTRNSPKAFKEEINTSAKVLVLDIETAPIRAYVWGIWNVNIGTHQIQSDWFCLTWAAKWLFEDKVYSGKLKPKEIAEQNDKRIIEGIWKLINEADIVIAHNGEKFDIPKLNSRFILNGLQPPLPYQQIDTLKHIRRQFGFTSNKLDYVNKLLNLERKKDTNFELWERCMKGNASALSEMEEYNVQDVRILEETYLQIRAWIKPHPNMGLFILDEREHRCPNCGSAELTEQGKNYNTTANVYTLMRCNNCGAASRKRLGAATIKEKRHLLISTAK